MYVSQSLVFKLTVARELHAKDNKYFAYCVPDFSRTRESNLSKEQFWQRRREEDISIEIYAAKGSHISAGGGGSQTAPSVSDDLNHKTRIHEKEPAFLLSLYCLLLPWPNPSAIVKGIVSPVEYFC